MKPFQTIVKRKIPARVICLALVLAFVAPYNSIDAQISVGELFQRTLPKGEKKDTSDKTCRGQFCGRVFISPDEIHISPDSVRGDTVVLTLELSNRTDTAITGLWKTYEVLPPQIIPIDSVDTEPLDKKKGRSLLASEDNDSSVVGMSLSPWITGFPDSIVIGPHSTIHMNVVIRFPKDLKQGTYTGWLGATSRYFGDRLPPQKPIRLGIISKVKIIYEARAVK